MKKLKRIVVGIDVLSKSSNILKRAVILAKENEADLFIVHAVQTPWLSLPGYFGGKEITVDAKGITKKIEKKIKAVNKDDKVSYTIIVKEGDADDILLYESKLLKADMIVIGKHTKSKTGENILGSIAQKVAHKSHLPILIVKNKVKDSYKNVLAPTDFGVQSKQSILFVKNICPSAKIRAVFAYESFYTAGIYTTGAYPLETVENFDIQQYDKAEKAAAKNNLKEFIKAVGIDGGKVIDGKYDSKKALLKYIKKNTFDLVVVGSRGTAGFNALLGSVASYVLKEAPTDVLVYVPID
ncbi:universal stress protein [Sulfurovum sp.]|uniref:universal stress protein n=1 Tax=Sulfurovum sp. TaxID=1969726 RepID=UPI0025D211FE|nr:universal stress protein [Sulfurovum sp.]